MHRVTFVETYQTRNRFYRFLVEPSKGQSYYQSYRVYPPDQTVEQAQRKLEEFLKDVGYDLD